MSPSPERRHLAERLRELGDVHRLAMVGLLARRPHYGEEFADALGLSAATVSHHLRRLRSVGLVEARREPPHVSFRLREGVLEELGGLLVTPRELGPRLDLPDEQTLGDRLVAPLLDVDGRLRALPTRKRARKAALRWAAGHFDTRRLYPERELRLRLLEIAREPEELREALVRAGHLQRSGTVYRKIEEVESR